MGRGAVCRCRAPSGQRRARSQVSIGFGPHPREQRRKEIARETRENDPPRSMFNVQPSCEVSRARPKFPAMGTRSNAGLWLCAAGSTRFVGILLAESADGVSARRRGTEGWERRAEAAIGQTKGYTTVTRQPRACEQGIIERRIESDASGCRRR